MSAADPNYPGEPPDPPPHDELVRRVRAFPYWYQRIYLGRGVYTLEHPAFHEGVWEHLKRAVPADLRGAAVLDVGCNAGFFALQAKFRGAGRVVGLESIDGYARQAELCREIWKADIDYRRVDVHDMHQLDGPFDLVVFAGILYHLKNPLLVIEHVGQLCRDAVLIETEVLAEEPGNVVHVRQGPNGKVRTVPMRTGIMKFLERDELNGDGSNWWVPDTECVLAMLRTAGFRHFSRPIYFTEGRMILAASKTPSSLLDLSAL